MRLRKRENKYQIVIDRLTGHNLEKSLQLTKKWTSQKTDINRDDADNNAENGDIGKDKNIGT